MSTNAPVPTSDPGNASAPQPAQPSSPCAPPPTQILNLFLHGLFVLSDRADTIEALLPAMPDHTFRFGEFLGETELQERPFCHPYELEGVTGGCAKLDRSLNLSLKSSQPNSNCEHSELHCRLVLPRPIEIFTLRNFDVSTFLSDATPFEFTNVSTLHVFTYAYQNSDDITLGDHIFTKSQQIRNGKTYMSLHVFSEEDFFPDDDQHPLQGFDAMIRLFPGLRVFLKTDPPTLPDITETQIAPGTILPEYEDLRFRTAERLALIGRQMRSGTFPKFWGEGGTPEGSSIRTCTRVLSGPGGGD